MCARNTQKASTTSRSIKPADICIKFIVPEHSKRCQGKRERATNHLCRPCQIRWTRTRSLFLFIVVFLSSLHTFLEYSQSGTNEIASKVKLHPCTLLMENNFHDCTKAHKLALIATYKRNCGHCMSLRPIFDKAAHALRIPLFGIDMRSQNVLMDKLGIDEVPTLLIYRNGKAPVVYGGVQNAKAIVDYVKILAKGAAVKLPSESEIYSQAKYTQQNLPNRISSLKCH